MKTLYVIHHTHTDIGYTELQGRVARWQSDFIRQALDIIERTRKRVGPDFDGFRWMCETFWGVERFLQRATSDEAEAFVLDVVEGHRPGVSAVVRFRGRGGRRLASRLSHVLASTGYVVTDSGGSLVVTDRRLETEILRRAGEELELVAAARMIAVNGGEWDLVEELGRLEAVLVRIERGTDRIIGSGGVR